MRVSGLLKKIFEQLDAHVDSYESVLAELNAKEPEVILYSGTAKLKDTPYDIHIELTPYGGVNFTIYKQEQQRTETKTLSEHFFERVYLEDNLWLTVHPVYTNSFEFVYRDLPYKLHVRALACVLHKEADEYEIQTHRWVGAYVVVVGLSSFSKALEILHNKLKDTAHKHIEDWITTVKSMITGGTA